MVDTKVSTLTRIRQGKTTILFELLGGKLIIEWPRRGQDTLKLTISELGVIALKELLALEGPGPIHALQVEKGRFDPPTKREEGQPTPEGLTRFADNIEAGMQ